MDSTEHLTWCKERALEYADLGDTSGVLASMKSDMDKHPDTANSGAHMLGMMLAMSGHLSTPKQLRDWVEGFN